MPIFNFFPDLVQNMWYNHGNGKEFHGLTIVLDLCFKRLPQE